jgi:hypothetical protein
MMPMRSNMAAFATRALSKNTPGYGFPGFWHSLKRDRFAHSKSADNSYLHSSGISPCVVMCTASAGLMRTYHHCLFLAVWPVTLSGAH